MLTPAEHAVAKVLIGEGILPQDVVQAAGAEAVRQRATGNGADLIGVLVFTGKLTQPVAQQVMQAAQKNMETEGFAPPQAIEPPRALEDFYGDEQDLPDEEEDTSSGSGRRAGGQGSGRSGPTSARNASPSQNLVPYIALGVCAFLILGLGLFAALRDPKKGSAEDSKTPDKTGAKTLAKTLAETRDKTSAKTPDKTSAKTPAKTGKTRKTPAESPSERARREALAPVRAAEAKALYAEALRQLEAIPSQKRGLGFDSLQARLRRYLRYEKKLREALDEGAESRAFKRWIERIEGGKVEEDLLGLPATKAFREKAKKLVGQKLYDAIASGEDDMPDMPDMPDDE